MGVGRRRYGSQIAPDSSNDYEVIGTRKALEKSRTSIREEQESEGVGGRDRKGWRA